MERFILTTITLSLFTLEAIACTIIPKAFCTSIKIQDENLIVTGEIISMDEDGLDFRIIDVLRGIETRIEIRIWDGTDFDCNGIWPMDVSTIGSVNDTVIISLPKIDSIENDWDVIGDYRRPDPYSHTSELKVNNGIATGLIQGDAIAPPEYNLSSIEYTKLKESIIQNDECKDLISSINEIGAIVTFNYTNPIVSNFTIQDLNLNQVREINIYRSDGKKIFNKDLQNINQLNIDFSTNSSGLYILELRLSNNTIQTFKLIKI